MCQGLGGSPLLTCLPFLPQLDRALIEGPLGDSFPHCHGAPREPSHGENIISENMAALYLWLQPWPLGRLQMNWGGSTDSETKILSLPYQLLQKLLLDVMLTCSQPARVSK